MTRVDELQKKYPSLPRQYIVRWDARIHGLRDTGQIDEFGRWMRVAGTGGYATLDFDIELKDWVAARPGRQKPGYVLRPGKFVLPENGMEVCTQINTKSDLEIRFEGNGRFALYQGAERVEELWHQPVKERRENLTSTGKLESEFFARKSKYCFLMTPVRHCQYFPLGMACKFCDYNPTQEDARSIGVGRSTAVNVDEAVEAYRMFASEVRVIEGGFQSGGFTKSENEVRMYANFVEKMVSLTPYRPNFKAVIQPTPRKNLQRLRDLGLDCFLAQMEMWDANLFPEVVPGKAQYYGHDRFLETLQEAVDVFGVGNVKCGFPGGLGMIPDNGHKTWQEARDSMVEGYTWMIERGILPCTSALRLPPGSAYGSEENRKKAPPTEFYMELSVAHHVACMEHGLYQKLNKLLCCPLDTMGILIGSGELGAYELAGSLGNWSATVLPREANWFLDWEERRKSGA